MSNPCSVGSPIGNNPATPGTPNVSDDESEDFGVDPKNLGFAKSLSALIDGIGGLGRWFGRGLWTVIQGIVLRIAISCLFVVYLAVTGWGWIRQDRKNALVAGLSVAVLVLGLIAFRGHDSIPTDNPQPPPPTTQTDGHRRAPHKIENGESLASIGAKVGVSRAAMIAANPDLIRENTAWCLKRPVSMSYLKGLLANGKDKRDGSFCKLSDYNGEQLALDTARVGQMANFPADAMATNNANEN